LSGEGIGKGLALAFFLIIHCLPFCGAQDFPLIVRLDSRDAGFKQYISDVEYNRRRLLDRRNRPEAAAEYLTIYRYTTRPDDDIFSLAARCSIPYSALASLNRLSSAMVLGTGKQLLLPSCPGLFIPVDLESELEKLISAARFENQSFVSLKINTAEKSETFLFFPGADFTPTERVFFLNSGFRFPLQSFRITSDYGIRENPVTGNISMHQGIDLAAPEGTAVFAAAAGIVTGVGESPVYGNYVIITHGENLTSLYGHLQKIETVLYSTVRSGTLIGRVGSTGQSTGPHLHFELRRDGRALNPSGRLRP
jgi:murein DD-endopeptidase MepM/ murein hydrolase activator NlpD